MKSTWWPCSEFVAVCMNQTDDQEKNEQVRLMGQIYQRAKWVCVWLGEGADDSDFLMDMANFYNSYSMEEVRGITQLCLLPDINVNLSEALEGFGHHIQVLLRGEETRALLFRSLHRLLQRSYWSRIWIVQENRMANNNVIIHRGAKRVFWSLLHTVGREVQNFRLVPSSDDHLFLASFFWRDVRPSAELDRHEQLLTLIKRYKSWSCHDPRDKIYALLGLARDCKDGNGLRPDYSKAKVVVLWDVIAFCNPPTGELTDIALMLQGSLDVSGAEVLASRSMVGQQEPDLPLKVDDKQFSTLQRSAVGIIVEMQICRSDGEERSEKILRYPSLAFIADVFSPDAEDSEDDTDSNSDEPETARVQEARPTLADSLAKALYRFRFMTSSIRLITNSLPAPSFVLAKVLVFEDWTFRSRFSGEELMFRSSDEAIFTTYDSQAPEQDLIRIEFDRRALDSAIELAL